MKSGRAFWGTLFLIIGVLGLLNNFFSLSIDWDTAWKFWPLLLVLVGVTMFMKNSRNKWIIVAVVGLTAGIVIFSSVQKGCSAVDTIVEGDIGDWVDDDSSDYTRSTQDFVAEADSAIERAAFNFESGAGEFRITESTARLFEASTETSIGVYKLANSDRDGVHVIDFGPEDTHISWHGKKHRNYVAMRLNPTPLWDVRFDIGAAKAELDLRQLRIAKLDIDAGAASMNVRLGDRADTTRINIDTGASSIRITVPAMSDCEVRTESALSSKHLDDLQKVRDGLYRSANFGSGAKVVLIDIESGLSSITVEKER